ncbi:DsrE family protein [Mesobacterium sp. TK19101]|uniref:DsrE family protein n=1 Tax=Mesobacterium hydrothermale TaxID=3111907 RepID=A0ABU6HK99_9RHOB|nr:DsrE family protein [Mesobacterium sp. TK19101]MEC3862542.1 DsrE family protein [Mesobacterium sp. TK19101]
MKTFFKQMLLALSLVILPLAASAEDGKRGLFVNLTTDDTWSAAKAIMFAHQKSLKGGHDTAIWLNVRAVYLADKKRPSNIPGVMAEQGTTIQDMLKAFMADGGTVLMCAACSQAAGLTKEDYIDGVVMGSWPVVEGWLFREDMQTLSW